MNAASVRRVTDPGRLDPIAVTIDNRLRQAARRLSRQGNASVASSRSSHRTLVIIPAYNESENIARVVSEVREHFPDADITVVDDGSTDGTYEKAVTAGARAVRLPFNLGVGGAMQTGFRLAVESGYDIGVQVDADGQHPATEIDKILAPVLAAEADAVIGTRYRDDRGYVTPAGRRVAQRFFAALVRFLTGHDFTDTTSGFRAYNRNALEFLARHYSRDYPEVNAVVDLCHNGFRIQEVPVHMRDRQAGVSHITLRRSIYYMLKVSLATLITATRRRERKSR